jgi:predicted AlkP superfamily pyrophosphatase or phosphodiesterase
MTTTRKPKVLIVGIDGCRPDALQAAQTPNIDKLIGGGAYSFDAQTCALTKSGPSWASVLTGVWPDKHGVINNSMAGERFDQYPHFFKRLRELRPDLYTASIVHWEPIHSQIVSGADQSMAYPIDEEVTDAAVRLLAESRLDMLFLHFDDVDGAGHRNGYSAKAREYVDAISQIDSYVGEIITALSARPTYAQEEWLIVATTDHGGSDVRGPEDKKYRHGDDVPEHRTVFLIISGDSTMTGRIEPAPVSVDIPPTILTHLGVEFDPAWGWEGHAVGLKS